jgi:hypothetical protein
MAASSYELARQLAESLSQEDQLRLIEELSARNAGHPGSQGRVSIMELQGLGKEIWQGIDAQEYVDRERSSWNG